MAKNKDKTKKQKTAKKDVTQGINITTVNTKRRPPRPIVIGGKQNTLRFFQ